MPQLVLVTYIVPRFTSFAKFWENHLLSLQSAGAWLILLLSLQSAGGLIDTSSFASICRGLIDPPSFSSICRRLIDTPSFSSICRGLIDTLWLQVVCALYTTNSRAVVTYHIMRILCCKLHLVLLLLLSTSQCIFSDGCSSVQTFFDPDECKKNCHIPPFHFCTNFSELISHICIYKVQSRQVQITSSQSLLLKIQIGFTLA